MNHTLLESKTISPLWAQVQQMDSIIKRGSAHFEYDKGIRITLDSSANIEQIANLAMSLKSWRKGPFFIDTLFIDSEWRSFIKWDFLRPYIHIENVHIADVGCNNGFYMFAMNKQNPKSITGFDPSGLFFCQFQFINHFLDLPITYELLGIDDIRHYPKKFDVIFCLGVLYHRTDVLGALKSLAQGLQKGGILILDSLIIDSLLEVALCPKESYAKMSNVYFIPSIKTMQGWLERCGFCDIELLGVIPTTTNEQRKTQWIDSLSLESFLDPNDSSRTIEGYIAPQRGYFKARRK